MPSPTRSATADRRQGRLLALLVFSVAVLVYLNTLALGFTWDDHTLVLRNPHIADWSYVKTLFTAERLWRPVERLALMADYALWGPQRPFGFHLTNILLHAAACVVLFQFLLRLSAPGVISDGPLQGRPAASRRLAGIASVLFAVHPVHVEAVANISHRKEPMVLLFDLLALLSYLAARSEKRRSDLARAGYLLLTLLLYLAGMLSKEVGAVMLPLVILVYELAFRGRTRQQRRSAVGLFLALAVPIVVLFYYRGDLGSIGRRFTSEEIHDWVTHGETTSYARVLMASIKGFGIYVGLLVWPWPLYLDRYFTLPTGFFEEAVLVGLALMVVYLVMLVRAWKSSRLAFFALAWCGIHWIPVSNLVPFTHWLVAERFLYVPSAGFCLLVALWLDPLWTQQPSDPRAAARHRLLGCGVVSGLVAVLAALTITQNRVWTSETTLWTQTLRFNPGSYRANYGLALELAGRGDHAASEKLYLRAIADGPWDPEPLYGLSVLYLGQGKFEEAAQTARRYAERMKDDARPWVVVGNARLGQGRFEEAVAAYRVVLEKDPLVEGGHYNLANALAAAGRIDEAIRVIDDAARDRPSAALFGLRATILERAGRGDEAAESRQQALSLGVLAAPTRPLSGAPAPP